MDVASAEMPKYASNAMLAVRISFMNEIANLCQVAGADVDLVRVGMGTDSRIGMSFLFPGIGYGGSCFPKDVQALIRTAREHGVHLRMGVAAEEVNKHQKAVLGGRIESVLGSQLNGKTIGVWGLAFKPKTDDVREAPAQVVISNLLDNGATVKAFDPEANETFSRLVGNRPKLSYVESAYEAVRDADALVICTEWNEFRRPNFEKVKGLMKRPVIFDGRNIFDPQRMSARGFEYHCIGRNSHGGKA